MLGCVMPDKAILHHTELCVSVPSPAVAMPIGNGTTRHSRTVSHRGHAWAAPLREAPGQWDLLGMGPAGTQQQGAAGGVGAGRDCQGLQDCWP